MIKYNRKGINYPSAKGEWKRLEKNNSRISFNMLKKNIYPAYISQHSSDKAETKHIIP